MARFKEFYNEGFAAIAGKAMVGRFIGKKLKDIALTKMGLNTKSLGVLTGGKYFKWKSADQKKFKRDYSTFIKDNGDITDENEKTFKALKFLDKKGNAATKENKFYKKGMDIKRFTQNLQIISRVKGAFDFLKQTTSGQGDSIISILKAIK